MALAYRDAALRERARAERLQKQLNGEHLRAQPAKRLLVKVPPDLVDELDRKFAELGEEWHPHPDVEYVYDDDDWMPARHAAQVAGVTATTINRARAAGQLPAKYVGREYGYVFCVADIKAWRASVGPGPGSRPKLRT
jgi:hypothetical protein